MRKIIDNSAARAAVQRKERQQAGLVNDDYQRQLDESYRLAKLRADAEADLARQAGQASTNSAGSGPGKADGK
ncbi:MAG TPA: hypothetical protein VFF73_36125 [Planctomycetota bacterium]|nr:hypothetical protein [Planctomycetota bacterium]